MTSAEGILVGVLFATAGMGPLYLLYSHFFRDLPMGGPAFLRADDHNDRELNQQNITAQRRADQFIRHYLWPIPLGAAIGAIVTLLVF